MAASSSSASNSSSSSSSSLPLQERDSSAIEATVAKANKSSSSSLEVFQRDVGCIAVLIKGTADTATNQKRGAMKNALLTHLASALVQTNLLPPRELLNVISDYVLALLKDDPACFALHLPKTSRLLGFNVGTVEVGRGNALFVTMGTSAGPTPSARCVRMEYGGNNTLVGSPWEIPYDLSYDEPYNRAHVVQTSTTPLAFQIVSSTEGLDCSPPWIACYDPYLRRVWEKQDVRSLVALATENSQDIRYFPSVASWVPPFSRTSQDVLFAQKVSLSKMVVVHRDALRLFSTKGVEQGGVCTGMGESYSPADPFVAATAIPNSNRFIAALSVRRMIFFSPDLERDRFTIQHDFVIEAQENITYTSSMFTMASHSTACATAQNVHVRRSSSRAYDWDCGISLWDHETVQRISYVGLGLQFRAQNSWFADNDVLILSHSNRHGDMDSLSMIDFRVDSQAVVKTMDLILL